MIRLSVDLPDHGFALSQDLMASFYVTGGTLQHDAPSYVERQADKDLFDGLLNGDFCYVLTSRQMGKSSLMVRTANKLRALGVNVLALDHTAIGQNLTAEQWYDRLMVRMGRQLRMEAELDDYWLNNERLGPLQRMMGALQESHPASVESTRRAETGPR